MAVTLDAPAVGRSRARAGEPAPVLIGFAEALAAPEAAWSLLESGARVVAFTRRGASPSLRRCEEIELKEITAPETDAARSKADLTALLRSSGYRAVLPLDDSAVWLCGAASEGPPTPVVGPTGKRAALALDKRLQLRAAARAGLHVPPTRVIESVDELLATRERPVQLKPAEPVAARGGMLVRGGNYICGSSAELRAAARSWDGAYPLLAQPLLHGVGEGLFGLARPAGIEAWSAHRRIRMMNPHGSGSSACISVAVDAALAERATRMLEESEWTGMFMLEFLRGHDGTPWFMELNGRPWGSMALARRCGLEYPAWALAQLLDPGFRVPATPPEEGRRCRHLGRELVHLLMVLRGPQSEAVEHWPSRWSTAREVLRVRRADDWYNWRPGAPGLFVEDTVRTVLDQLPRGLGAWRAHA